MPQPTDLPTWATSATGIANTVQPTAGQQVDGIAVGQRFAAQYWNWVWNRTGQWLAFFKNLVNGVEAWLTTQTFSGSPAVILTDRLRLGTGTGDTLAQADSVDAVTTRKLVYRSQPGGTGVAQRLYVTNTGFELTSNAAWNGTQWVPDVTAQAGLLRFTNAGTFNINYFSTATAGVGFADSAWNYQFQQGFVSGGNQSLDNSGITGPGSTTAYFDMSGTATGVQTWSSAVSFRKKFPANPTSATFVQNFAPVNCNNPVGAFLRPEGMEGFMSSAAAGAFTASGVFTVS